MKKIILLLMVVSFTFSCSKEEIKDNFDHKDITTSTDLVDAWIPKHAVIHGAELDGKALNDVEKAALELTVKEAVTLHIKKDKKVIINIKNEAVNGSWTNDKLPYDISFTDGNTVFAADAILKIENKRLYLVFGPNDHIFEGEDKSILFTELKLELIRKD